MKYIMTLHLKNGHTIRMGGKTKSHLLEAAKAHRKIETISFEK